MGSQKPAPIAAVVSKSGKKIFESGPLYVVKALPYYLVLRGQNYASLELSKNDYTCINMLNAVGHRRSQNCKIDFF